MRRLGLRVLMAAVGFSLLAFYLLAAWVVWVVLRAVWLSRPDPVTTGAIVGGSALLAGYLSYRFGTARLVAGIDAVPLPRDLAPGFHRRLDRLCDSMGRSPPRVLVARMPVPNAFTVGGVGPGVIVLDRRLFRLLTADELEAIVAHELAHLEGRDGLIQTLAYGAIRSVVGVVLLALFPFLLVLTGLSRSFAWIVGRPVGWAGNPLEGARRIVQVGVVGVFFALTLLVLAHSRSREFAADDRAVELTGKPLALARALATIDRTAEYEWRLRRTLYVGGEEVDALPGWLSTHPSMGERIDRLRRRATRG